MKIKISILSFCILCTFLTSCEEKSATEPPPAVQQTVGYVVGNNGMIMKSSDEGITWINLNSGVSNNLNSVLSVSITNTWIVGDNGLILHTSNGGNEWIVQQSNTTVNLKSISLNTLGNKAWISGDGGTIIFLDINN